MDSSAEACGKVDTTYYGVAPPPPFLAPGGAFLHMCSREGLLDLKNEKYVVSLSFIWAGLSSRSCILEYLSTGNRLLLLSC